ncbi:unnamed protein product [Urochloa decumbens]|uniref:DUF1618 domain-containing protein n=1 Tax=Urochloa decumbens TaxID=240449 RepID=A0ABC9ANN7_9POAL
METEASDLPAAAAACPRWVMLNRHSHHQFADAKTTTSASSHTSTGHLFRVSFRLVPPPACSSFYSDWAGSDHVPNQDPQIVASHGDYLLLDVTLPNRKYDTIVTDYFLYEAGGGSVQPLPALSLLPTCFFPKAFQRGEETGCRATPKQRHLWKDDTGVLRRSSGEVTVAQLEVPKPEGWKVRDKAELCVIDTGSLEWELHREIPIIFSDATAGKAEELMAWWETDVAVPVGDRFLCFVDYFRGFPLCDVVALGLRYVPLPVEHPNGCPNFDDDRPCISCMQMFRNLAAAGAGAVRFVTVNSRCCCGAAGKSTCETGQFLFTVTTWTLSLDVDEEAAAWVKDGVLDCEEIWAMPGYGSLPRRQLTFPIWSCDDPDIVCFMVRNAAYRYGKDRKVWMLEIDIRSKTMRSVALYNNVEDQAEYQVAVKLQC